MGHNALYCILCIQWFVFFFWFMNISTNLLVMKNEKWKLQQYNLWSSNPGHTRISVYDIHHEWSIETPDSRFWLTDYSSLTFYLTQHLKNYSMIINTWHLNVVVEFEVIIFIFQFLLTTEYINEMKILIKRKLVSQFSQYGGKIISPCMGIGQHLF